MSDKPGQGLGIVAYMPTSGDINPRAAKTYFAELTARASVELPLYRIDPEPCSNLAHSFNRGLCFALNLIAAGKPASHLFMLHSDIGPHQAYPLDILWDEMQRTQADWISAAVAIKDLHGNTSTAIGQHDCWNPWARITLHELHQLPETFSIEDLGESAETLGFKLLLNTGCMLIDLRKPYWSRVGDRGELEPHFEIRNRIVYIPGKVDPWEAQTETEDWLLSRILHNYGAKLFCTRKVTVNHYGVIPFSSAQPWGDWQQDQCGGRAAQKLAEKVMEQQKLPIHEHGYWLEDLPDGELHDEALEAQLVKLCKQLNYKSVTDLGCGRGWYANALASAGINVVAVDGNPNVYNNALNCSHNIDHGPSFFQVDLAEQQRFVTTDMVLCLEVGEHIPDEYSDILFGNICRAAKHLVVLSWAVPGQPGHGHVNCRPNEWVIEKMEQRGFVHNEVIQTMLRNFSVLPYFANTIMVFERHSDVPPQDEDPAEFEPCNKPAASEPEPATIEDEGGTVIGYNTNEFATRAGQRVSDFVSRELVKTWVPNIHSMVTYEELVAKSLVLASRLPSDVRGVLGISRRGMIPASIIASRLHLPLGEVETYVENGFFGSGSRRPLYSGPGPIVVVDDGTGSGTEMARAMQYLSRGRPDDLFMAAAVFVRDAVDSGCDQFVEPLYERHQESEFLNTRAVDRYLVDLDGVICEMQNDVSYESDDEDEWRRRFQAAIPKYLPRYRSVMAIVTSRLEKYRGVTVEWLNRWGVKYRSLLMSPLSSAVERDSDPANHGGYKAAVYKSYTNAMLFVESELDQAQMIFNMTGKPVFCTSTKSMVH